MRLIDADALKEKILAERDMIPKTIGSSIGAERPYHHGNAMRGGIRKALCCLEQTHTIDPESLRKKGEWLMRGGKRYCTHCGKRACVTRDSEDFWYTVGTDFCPNCGADMRGEDNGC